MPATGYRYLINLPGVRGGNMIVEGTRIGVHDVTGLVVNGASVEDVVRSFPDLTRAQVYECLAYYEDHRAEIDALIAQCRKDPSEGASVAEDPFAAVIGAFEGAHEATGRMAEEILYGKGK
jgi:uncharacterized protein (DUF433 family)